MYTPPFCTYFEAELSGEGLLKCSVSPMHMPPTHLAILCMRLKITATAMALWKKGSFTERTPRTISGTCVDTKPRAIEATYIFSGDKEQPHVT